MGSRYVVQQLGFELIDISLLSFKLYHDGHINFHMLCCRGMCKMYNDVHDLDRNDSDTYFPEYS